MTKKFYFTPLRPKKNIPADIYACISKTGTIRFNESVLLNLGIDINGAGTWIYLYGDVDNRSLAFRFSSKAPLKKEKHCRFIKVSKNKKTGYRYIVLSVRTFLKLIYDTKLPSGRLEIKEYIDDIIGTVRYIRIPRASVLMLNKEVDEE